jgi:hypothetical protein
MGGGHNQRRGDANGAQHTINRILIETGNQRMKQLSIRPSLRLWCSFWLCCEAIEVEMEVREMKRCTNQAVI